MVLTLAVIESAEDFDDELVSGHDSSSGEANFESSKLAVGSRFSFYCFRGALTVQA